MLPFRPEDLLVLEVPFLPGKDNVKQDKSTALRESDL